MRKLETEADVINLIGYDTAMEFVFVSDNIAAFNTVLPTLAGNYYEVEFFRNEDSPFEFFKIDSFSRFLQCYRIHTVYRIEDVTKTKEQIYFKQYQSE